MTSLRKYKFSDFNQQKLRTLLGLGASTAWQIPAHPVPLSTDFLQQLQRFSNAFDFTASEAARVLLIDIYLQEAMQVHPQLRIWKEMLLQTDRLTGYVDYLIAPFDRTPTFPLLCVVEAKKDNFERGGAQCLAEMYACRWQNTQIVREQPVYGIVSNGYAWQFYQLSENQLLESATYGTANQADLLGALDYILGECEKLIKNV